MAKDSDSPTPDDAGPQDSENGDSAPIVGTLIDVAIEEELKNSYLTYAMSVIVSRALPDVRDGLKPSQRRILVAMNDLNLSPGASRIKCAKISGDTSGNYHPHGESVIYPTLVRMAQEWNMRHVLVDKQGNFGSIAGLPPAAMRYTEARMASPAALMLDDLNLDTVDYLPTYDERRTEPTVLPSKFPNLLVNGSNGIAVGYTTSIPPHNLSEICDAIARVISDPGVSVDELLEMCPGPDFPTGGVVCGRTGIRQGYHTGRGKFTLRARADIEEFKKGRMRIIVREIPYQTARDRIEENIAALVNSGRIEGISGVRNESDLKEPVRLIIEVKRDADPDVVLNQLYRFSQLQVTFSLNFLVLVDGKPRQMSIKRLIEEYIRHRTEVIRRRTQFLMAKARSRKHTVEGLLLALANIDEVVKVIRNSGTQAQAKERLMQIECPAALLERALGQRGFTAFQEERGEAGSYTLTPVQADAILKMTLGQLVNLEQERLGDEHQKLLNNIAEYLEILSDHSNLLKIVRDDLAELKRKHGEPRRTQLSGEEIGDVDLEDLITEETMVVSISHSGRIKRTPASVYRSQRRGGKGLKGAKTEDEDPIEHLFVASTHAYLLFFTNKGRVYWQKVYGLPQLGRDSRGRAVVNLLNLNPEEKIADCRAVRDFDKPGHFLMMATARGLVKKTPLEAYSRPRQGGIIAINLREGDELVDVVVTKPGDEVVLASAGGMSIRFKESDVRSMGRNSMGVKGISLSAGDPLVGMVVVDPQATLLTACANGYGKRTLFGLGESSSANQAEGEDEEADETSSTSRYRTQRRGGKGVRDIKTTKRNGPVIGITRVTDGDEVMIMTRRGKIQRIAASDVSVIGRNTQGVRIMSIGADDSLVAVVRVPKEENGEEHQETASPSISEEQADRSESENVRTEMDPDADNK